MNILRISNYKDKIQASLPATNPLLKRYPIQQDRIIADTFDVTFTGEEPEIPQDPIKLYEARQISGIHCPSCGVKMLAKKDFKNFVENAKNIQNTNQLVELLKKNNEFIPIAYKRILNDYKRIPNYKDTSITNFLISLRDIALYERERYIRNFKHEAERYLPNIPEEDIPAYKDFVESLNEKDTYQQVTLKIQKLVEDSNLDKNHLKNIKRNNILNIALAEKYYNMLNIESLEQLDDSTAAQQFIDRLFHPSRNKIRKIEKYEYNLDHPNNKIMICKDCATKYTSERKVFFNNKNQPDLKANVILYLKDLSFLCGAKMLDIPANYQAYVCNRVNQLTGQNVFFSKFDIQKIYNAQNIMSRHEKFSPIIQSEVDIPCAECGSTLMPHSVKLKVIKDLNTCRTPYDYSEVLKKYQKYEGPYSRKLIEIFNEIVENNPYISNEKFLEKFSSSTERYLRRGVYHILADYKCSRKFYDTDDKRQKLNVFDLIYYRTKRYIDKRKFDDYDMGNFCKTVLDGVQLSDYNIKAASNLIRQLRVISYKHSLAFPYNPNNKDNQSKVCSITYNLLMSDLATADHLVAVDKGGDGTKYNLIGMCKSCNKLKSNNSVIAWYDQHPGVKKNLINQIIIINDMAKDGYLEDYDDWAKRVVQNLYNNTNGAINYIEIFEK